jgi:cob(I)alamin adenosyltransferase
MPIYTKKGDKGETSLFGGKRVSKTHTRVDAYGTVDELSSIVGIIVAFLPARHHQIKQKLEDIQHDFLEIGANLANPMAEPLDYLDQRITEFENDIDLWTEKLSELKNFILPGGGKSGAMLHQARTVTRRVERRLVALMHEEDIDEKIVKYFNRLSDYFFTLARYINHLDRKKETIWKTRTKKDALADSVVKERT